MRKSVILAIIATLALQLHALDVNNTAGSLSSRITDLQVASLTIRGSMNAEDFYFIGNKLHQLKTIDLSQVTVEPCHSAQRHYWQQDFQAGELPAGAFADMKVTSVSLPASLKWIGKGAFAGCRSLTGVTLPASLDSIGDYAFAGCAALTSITLPASVIKVGQGAFMRCTALTTLKVEPSSRLRQIDATALMDCPALTTVKLGSAMQSVGERALAGTGVRQLDMTESASLKELGPWAMVLTPVTQAKLPNSVNTVGEGAFMYATALTDITLGGHVSQLSDYLLAGTSLEAIDLTGVSALGDYALYNNDRVSVVELPASTTWLGTRAMAGMTGMTAITSNAAEVPALGQDVWLGVNQSQIPLTVPNSAIAQYKEAEQWKEFMIADPGWLVGDVNLDGEVNIADVNAVVSIIQGNPADEGTLQRADVNEDGEINIADINLIINIIMTGSINMPARIDVNDQLHLDNASLRPGEERTLSVTLDNARNYSAMQCDIILPAGLTLVETRTARTHSSETNDVDAATSRTVVYSSRKQSFNEDQPVITLTVRADDALASDSQIQLTNIVLADGNDAGWHAADCTANISNSTGINNLSANNDRLWIEVHTLCIDTQHAGTAQVTAINGVNRPFDLSAGINRIELETGFYVVIVNGKGHKIAIK